MTKISNFIPGTRVIFGNVEMRSLQGRGGIVLKANKKTGKVEVKVDHTYNVYTAFHTNLVLADEYDAPVSVLEFGGFCDEFFLCHI